MSAIRFALFVKRCTSKDGKRFYVYVANLERKDGSKQYVTVKFSGDQKAPDPEECPMYILANREGSNLSRKIRNYTDPDTGEIHQVENYTLWVKSYSVSDEPYVDHSLDDFA